MKNLAIGLVVAAGLLMTQPLRAELIVLAAPRDGEPYYADVLDDILNFHIEFARCLARHGDRVLVLTGPALYDDYVEALGEDQVAIALKQVQAATTREVVLVPRAGSATWAAA